jgi:hypothetical protein
VLPVSQYAMKAHKRQRSVASGFAIGGQRWKSWRNVVIRRDSDNFCTKAEIFEIRQRGTFLCRAYQFALSKMNKWTCYKCYQQACNELNALEMAQATWYKTIASWNMMYRQFEGFPHPSPYVQC